MKKLFLAVALEVLAADIVYRVAIRPTVQRIVYR
jgi:hypothetical protein